jgi:methionyl-tRNA formyltransferase
MEAAAPGTLHLQDKQLYVLCGGTTHLRLTAVKVEGRNRISPLEFANGARLTKKERFGDS